MDQGERQEEGQEEETARKWTLVERNKDPHLDHQQNRNKEQTQWKDRHTARLSHQRAAPFRVSWQQRSEQNRKYSLFLAHLTQKGILYSFFPIFVYIFIFNLYC